MSSPCLIRQEFHSQVFGVDFYRLVRFEPRALAGELARLASRPEPFKAQARLDAVDIEGAKVLVAMGFAKVCVQALFTIDLTRRTLAGPALRPETVVSLSDDEIDLHAKNLRYSCFGLDPRILGETWMNVHGKWLANSMADPNVFKFFEGSGFVSFEVVGDKAVIDLFSVPMARRGTGTALMTRLLDWAQVQGLTRLEVIAECENLPACLFYQKSGLSLSATISVFHVHKGTIL